MQELQIQDPVRLTGYGSKSEPRKTIRRRPIEIRTGFITTKMKTLF